MTREPGYLLRCEEDEFDVARFQRSASRVSRPRRSHSGAGSRCPISRCGASPSPTSLGSRRAARVHGRAHRPGSPRRAACRADRRDGRPCQRVPAARAATRPVDARPLSLRAAGRGAGRLPARPECARRGARDRARQAAARSPPGSADQDPALDLPPRRERERDPRRFGAPDGDRGSGALAHGAPSVGGAGRATLPRRACASRAGRRYLGGRARGQSGGSSRSSSRSRRLFGTRRESRPGGPQRVVAPYLEAMRARSEDSEAISRSTSVTR